MQRPRLSAGEDEHCCLKATVLAVVHRRSLELAASRREHRMRYCRLLGLICVVVITGCDKDSSPSPTSPTTTATTAAEPTVSEVFEGILPVGGSKFFSFTTSTYGRVDATLISVGGAFVPSTVWVGLGLGQPSGTDCATTTSMNTAAASAPQVTGTYTAGVYCVRVADIGNLFAPASFSVTIAYP